MNMSMRAFVGQYDWGWVNEQVQILRSEDTSGMMAIDLDKNETVGAVIFDNWTPNSVTAHIMFTTPMVLRHGFLEEAFNFVFNTCDRKYVLGIVKSDNEKAQKFDENMGFVEQFRLKDGHCDGTDIIYYAMHRDDCKFLSKIKKAEVVNG